MAFNKVALLILFAIFAGTILLLSEVDAANACPRNCNPSIQYGRCPKSGNKKFKVGCTNCCSGTEGCNYYSANGTFICEGQTKKTIDETNKACPRNCNPRIAYSICPGNKRSEGRICTNCCAGSKGCNYYTVDGTFVCEGESKVDSS